ncbi:hypothetical protein HAZT_HAZT002279 [Hyalella azteca]|uniref:Ig-like domain-containing protein n=1 Tax=Hyalella azteca TaxID=294128 RepID=A0A6A0H364_HYAAZ|nr:hypothetical protein HAZT_HAZT002279 [Hyalella azteca]
MTQTDEELVVAVEGVAFHRYDARYPGRQQHSSREPSLQASFRSDPPARLLLPRVTADLAGEYECRVDYLHAPSDTTRVELSVLEPPESLHLLTADGRAAPQLLTVNAGDALHVLCKVLGAPPSSVDISGIPPSVAAGEKLKVWCSAPHARPSPVLVWTLIRKGKPAKVLAKQERNVSRSWQDVQVEWQDHGASLTCTAYSPALPAVRVSNSSLLNVTFAPRVRMSLGAMLSADHIKEGSDVYFRCDIHSNPPPNRITWFHNVRELSNNTFTCIGHHE